MIEKSGKLFLISTITLFLWIAFIDVTSDLIDGDLSAIIGLALGFVWVLFGSMYWITRPFKNVVNYEAVNSKLPTRIHDDARQVSHPIGKEPDNLPKEVIGYIDRSNLKNHGNDFESVPLKHEVTNNDAGKPCGESDSMSYGNDQIAQDVDIDIMDFDKLVIFEQMGDMDRAMIFRRSHINDVRFDNLRSANRALISELVLEFLIMIVFMEMMGSQKPPKASSAHEAASILDFMRKKYKFMLRDEANKIYSNENRFFHLNLSSIKSHERVASDNDRVVDNIYITNINAIGLMYGFMISILSGNDNYEASLSMGVDPLRVLGAGGLMGVYFVFFETQSRGLSSGFKSRYFLM